MVLSKSWRGDDNQSKLENAATRFVVVKNGIARMCFVSSLYTWHSHGHFYVCSRVVRGPPAAFEKRVEDRQKLKQVINFWIICLYALFHFLIRTQNYRYNCCHKRSAIFYIKFNNLPVQLTIKNYFSVLNTRIKHNNSSLQFLVQFLQILIFKLGTNKLRSKLENFKLQNICKKIISTLYLFL